MLNKAISAIDHLWINSFTKEKGLLVRVEDGEVSTYMEVYFEKLPTDRSDANARWRIVKGEVCIGILSEYLDGRWGCYVEGLDYGPFALDVEAIDHAAKMYRRFSRQ